MPFKIKQNEFIPLAVVGAFIILYYLYKHTQQTAVTANAGFNIADCGDQI